MNEPSVAKLRRLLLCEMDWTLSAPKNWECSAKSLQGTSPPGDHCVPVQAMQPVPVAKPSPVKFAEQTQVAPDRGGSLSVQTALAAQGLLPAEQPSSASVQQQQQPRGSRSA